ncbi:hypothetical protein YC2023_055747 [Brassica napus]
MFCSSDCNFIETNLPKKRTILTQISIFVMYDKSRRWINKMIKRRVTYTSKVSKIDTTNIENFVAGLNYRYSPRIYLTYGTVDISNSYAIPHNESSDQVPLNFTPNYEFCFSSNGPCIKGVIGFTPNNNSLHSFKSFMLISVWLRLRELDDQLLLMYLPTIKHNKDTVESS